MKRHLWGFALFNLIVGTALIIAITTGNFRRPATKYTYDVSKQSCWNNVRQNSTGRSYYESNQDSIKVTQAVLNEQTNKLNMSFSVQRETPATQDITVKMIFASKENSDRDTDVRTEFVTLSPDFNVDNKAVYSTPLSYNWLNNFGKKENIYVKAEIYKGSSTDLETVSRTVNFNDFTPVLFVNKK